MAKFKTHVSLGVVLGISFLIVGLIFSIFKSVELMFWFLGAVIVGSFLPDLDYDGGIPFQILFGLLGAGLAGLGFYYFFQNGEDDLKILVGAPILIFLIVRFLFGFVFQMITRHRGVFHSVPAAILAGFLLIWVLYNFRFDFQESLILGAAVFIGYLGHLVLDEIYSSVNLRGFLIKPKKSLGSAVKFLASPKIIFFLVYFLIILIIFSLSEMRQFALSLFLRI